MYRLIMGSGSDLNLVVVERRVLCSTWYVAVVQGGRYANDLLDNRFSQGQAVFEGFVGGCSCPEDF